jgi:hypothetical protein
MLLFQKMQLVSTSIQMQFSVGSNEQIFLLANFKFLWSIQISDFEKSQLALKNDVFWDITQCGSCKNRRFGRTYPRRHQVNKNRRAKNYTANVVPILPIPLTLII